MSMTVVQGNKLNVSADIVQSNAHVPATVAAKSRKRREDVPPLDLEDGLLLNLASDRAALIDASKGLK